MLCVSVDKFFATYRNEFKLRAKSLEYLSGIITDLFVDWNKLQGFDVRNEISNFHQVLLSNDFDELVKAILTAHKALSSPVASRKKFQS